MTTETDNTRVSGGDGSTAREDQSEPTSAAPGAEEAGGGGGDPARAAGEAGDDQAQEASELDALRTERDKAKEQLLRMAADFDNFRKRSRREIEEAKVRGGDDAVRELLPVVDNLERAVSASEGASDVASVVEGVRMVLKLFQDTAERMGLQRVPTVGERFDPSVHEAIQQEETDEHPPGEIVREVMPGYLFGERLLRAAMVVVARPANKAAPESAADDAAANEEEAKSE